MSSVTKSVRLFAAVWTAARQASQKLLFTQHSSLTGHPLFILATPNLPPMVPFLEGQESKALVLDEGL